MTNRPTTIKADLAATLASMKEDGDPQTLQERLESQLWVAFNQAASNLGLFYRLMEDASNTMIVENFMRAGVNILQQILVEHDKRKKGASEKTPVFPTLKDTLNGKG